MPKAFVEVWRNKKSGEFMILSFAEDPAWKGVHREIDARVTIAEEEMRTRGLDIILTGLASYKERQGQAPVWLDEPRSEFNKKRRQYVAVSIMEKSAHELEIDPTRKEGRGWVGGLPEDRIVVELPCDNATFFAALVEALDQSQ